MAANSRRADASTRKRTTPSTREGFGFVGRLGDGRVRVGFAARFSARRASRCACGGFLREILRVNLISRAAPSRTAALGALGADGSRVVSPCRRHDVENQPIDDVVHGVARGAGRAVASTRRRGGGGRERRFRHGARARPCPSHAPGDGSRARGCRGGETARKSRRRVVRDATRFGKTSIPGFGFPGVSVLALSRRARARERASPPPPATAALCVPAPPHSLFPSPLPSVPPPSPGARRASRLQTRRAAAVSASEFRHRRDPEPGEAPPPRRPTTRSPRRAEPAEPGPRRPPRPARQDDDPVGTVVAGLGRAAIRGSRPERDERRQRVRRRRRGYEPTPAERDARRRRGGGGGGGGDDGGRRDVPPSALLLGRRRQNRRLGRFLTATSGGAVAGTGASRGVGSVPYARARARTIGSRVAREPAFAATSSPPSLPPRVARAP